MRQFRQSPPWRDLFLKICNAMKCPLAFCHSWTIRSNQQIFWVNKLSWITSWSDLFLSQHVELSSKWSVESGTTVFRADSLWICESLMIWESLSRDRRRDGRGHGFRLQTHYDSVLTLEWFWQNIFLLTGMHSSKPKGHVNIKMYRIYNRCTSTAFIFSQFLCR